MEEEGDGAVSLPRNWFRSGCSGPRIKESVLELRILAVTPSVTSCLGLSDGKDRCCGVGGGVCYVIIFLAALAQTIAFSPTPSLSQ